MVYLTMKLIDDVDYSYNKNTGNILTLREKYMLDKQERKGYWYEKSFVDTNCSYTRIIAAS